MRSRTPVGWTAVRDGISDTINRKHLFVAVVEGIIGDDELLPV